MKKFFTLILIIFSVVAQFSAQATYTWIAQTNNFFSDLNNWAPALTVVPSAGDTIVFSGATNDCDFDLSVTVAKIVIDNSYTGIINADFVPAPHTIGGDFLQDGGTFTMPSSVEFSVGRNFIKTGGVLTTAQTSALGLNGFGAQSIDLAGSSLAAINVYNTLTPRLVTLTGAVEITDSISVQNNVSLNTGGGLTLKANSTKTARVGQSTGNITGNAAVETFIPGTSTGWANLGAHGLDNLQISNWDGNGGLPMTCVGCQYDPSTVGNFFSIVGWDEVADDYDLTVTSATPLTPGKGFWVYVGSGASTTTDFTLVNTGNIVQGPGTIPVTKTGSGTNAGFNLIANPYPSPISFSTFIAIASNTIINDAVYIWNADLISGAGAYASYVAGVTSPGTGSIGDVIPAGQGFYVEATATGTLTYDESIKVNNNTNANPLLKTSSQADYGKIFRLKLKGPADWDATSFRVHPDATPVFDKKWDAHKILQSPGYVGYPGPYTHYTTISSKDAVNNDYAIHSIPSLTQDVRIPVLVRVSTTGTYTISAVETNDIHDCVMLKDNLLNITTDLKGGNYIFTISDTTSAPRFELILCRDSQLNLTGISETQQAHFISINQDAEGAFVNTTFPERTKATISVYNIVGQKLTEDIKVEGTVTHTALDLDIHNQVVLIRVITDKESRVKKIVIH